MPASFIPASRRLAAKKTGKPDIETMSAAESAGVSGGVSARSARRSPGQKVPWGQMDLEAWMDYLARPWFPADRYFIADDEPGGSFGNHIDT